MGLPLPGAQVDWRGAIEEKAATFRKARISIFDPSIGLDSPVIRGRMARAQQATSPIVATEAGEQLAKRNFLFEIELRPTDPPIRKGLVIRIHECETDPQLELFGFTVTNSVNSSEAALRTIQTSTDLSILERLPWA